MLFPWCSDSPHPSLVSIFTCVSYKSLQYHTYAEEYLGYPCACCKQRGKVHMVHDSGLHWLTRCILSVVWLQRIKRRVGWWEFRYHSCVQSILEHINVNCFYVWYIFNFRIRKKARRPFSFFFLLDVLSRSCSWWPSWRHGEWSDGELRHRPM